MLSNLSIGGCSVSSGFGQTEVLQYAAEWNQITFLHPTSRFVRFRWCRDGEAGPIPPSLRRGSNRDLAGRQEPIGLIAGNHGYDSIVFQSYRRSKDQMGTAPALIVLAIRARWVSESQVELSPGGRESCHFIQIPNDTWG